MSTLIESDAPFAMRDRERHTRSRRSGSRRRAPSYPPAADYDFMSPKHLDLEDGARTERDDGLPGLALSSIDSTSISSLPIADPASLSFELATPTTPEFPTTPPFMSMAPSSSSDGVASSATAATSSKPLKPSSASTSPPASSPAAPFADPTRIMHFALNDEKTRIERAREEDDSHTSIPIPPRIPRSMPGFTPVPTPHPTNDFEAFQATKCEQPQPNRTIRTDGRPRAVFVPSRQYACVRSSAFDDATALMEPRNSYTSAFNPHRDVLFAPPRKEVSERCQMTRFRRLHQDFRRYSCLNHSYTAAQFTAAASELGLSGHFDFEDDDIDHVGDSELAEGSEDAGVNCPVVSQPGSESANLESSESVVKSDIEPDIDPGYGEPEWLKELKRKPLSVQSRAELYFDSQRGFIMLQKTVQNGKMAMFARKSEVARQMHFKLRPRDGMQWVSMKRERAGDRSPQTMPQTPAKRNIGNGEHAPWTPEVDVKPTDAGVDVVRWIAGARARRRREMRYRKKEMKSEKTSARIDSEVTTTVHPGDLLRQTQQANISTTGDAEKASVGLQADTMTNGAMGDATLGLTEMAKSSALGEPTRPSTSLSWPSAMEGVLSTKEELNESPTVAADEDALIYGEDVKVNEDGPSGSTINEEPSDKGRSETPSQILDVDSAIGGEAISHRRVPQKRLRSVSLDYQCARMSKKSDGYRAPEEGYPSSSGYPRAYESKRSASTPPLPLLVIDDDDHPSLRAALPLL